MHFVRLLLAAAVLAFVAGRPTNAAPIPSGSTKPEAPAVTARRSLDAISDYHYQARSLNDVLADIKERARVNVTLDANVMNFGLDPNLPTVNVELKRVKLRDALKAALAPHNLRVGVVRDGLFVSTDEGVTAQQLRQAVSVNCQGIAFDKAVAALTADTGANVVIDPRLKEKATVPVVLTLDEVPLETAIRLLAEVADLRAVRLNNVMFLTTPDRAKVLRQDADGPIPPAQPSAGIVPQDVVRGINVAPAGPVVPLPAPVPEKAEPAKP